MVGRSQACPCGSGKKYKRCCGARAQAASGQSGGFPHAYQLYLAHQYVQAQQVCAQALTREPANLDGWFLSSAIALELQDYTNALAAMQRAAALAPRRAEVQFNIGCIRDKQGMTALAIEAYKAAVQLNSDYVQAWNNLGNACKLAGRDSDVIAACRHSVRLTPNAAPAWNNLGVALKAAGESEEAAACYRRAVECDSHGAPAHNNLGNLLLSQRKYEAAEASLSEALRLNPRFTEAWLNLGALQRATGRLLEGLSAYRQAIELEPDNPHAWKAYTASLQGVRYTADDPQGRRDLIAALDHESVDPLNLVPMAVSLLKCTPAIRALMQSDDAAPAFAVIEPLFSDELLGRLLESAVLADWQIEHALRSARGGLLRAVATGSLFSPAALAFAMRLAQQYWLTEYLAAESADETTLVAQLQNSIERDPARAVPAVIALYACYRPLHGMQCAETLLPGTLALARLLEVQVTAPRVEAHLRAALEKFGGVTDTVSRAVQAQYEEHPYPRWQRVGREAARPLLQIVRELAAATQLPITIAAQAPQVLVAGCGTGRHPLQTATRISGAQVLALDLSSASLAYAKRKAGELGIGNIEFMQADILELGQLARRFDLVESFGVLHHMADPLAGWRVLVELTKPGGLMLIGLYSERARWPVVACREFVRTGGYANNAADIRRFRQDLMRSGPREVVEKMLVSPDFYSVSDCRDLIFHVQEHRYTLPQIAAMGASLGLNCLGLELDDPTVYATAAGPLDTLPAPADLQAWDHFEAQHPDAFGSTYRIWWQKIG